MRIFSSLVVLLLLTSSPMGRAETAPLVVVERGAGAERCPDAEAIVAKIEQIRGRSALDAPTRYRVTMARTDDGFTAAIRAETSASSVRTLDHQGANCSALGNAVALTLALLLDSDVEPKKEIEPAPRPAPVVVATAAAPAPSAPAPARDATFSLAAAGLAGVLRPLSPALSAEVGVSFAPLRLSAGALWGFSQTLTFGPGTVHQRLLSGFARACVPTWQGARLRLDVCSGVFLGAIAAEAEEYTRNEQRTRAWVAVPLEAALASWTAPVGWEVSLAALLPLRRSDYTIDGLGTVYRSPPVGALLSLRLIGIVPW